MYGFIFILFYKIIVTVLVLDNGKCKKGKFIFSKYFVTMYGLIFNLFYKIFVTELVLDNGKGKKGK